MINKLIEFWQYLFPPNDWELIDIQQDYVLVDQHVDWVFKYTSKESRTYKIIYSKHRNIYKLEHEGYKSGEGWLYLEMIRKVLDLNTNQVI